MRKYSLLLMLFVGTMAFAQKAADVKKQINNIKKSSLYLYGEATAATEQDAKDMAEQILNDEINKWGAGQKKLRGADFILVNDRQEVTTSLSLPRGNMFRSFMYVKKTDVQKGGNMQVITPTGQSASVVETMEAPTPPVASVPKVEYPALVQELTKVKTFDEMARRLEQAKREGRVMAFARYDQLDDPAVCYIVTYDTAKQTIAAILAPGEQRVNVMTGEAEDMFKKYSGYGAFGFKLAE